MIPANPDPESSRIMAALHAIVSTNLSWEETIPVLILYSYPKTLVSFPVHILLSLRLRVIEEEGLQK